MDTQTVIDFRSFELNDVVSAGNGLKDGCLLDVIDISSAIADGFTEKRALNDGSDASDVYLSSRRIVLNGTLFGSTRSALFALLDQLLATFAPTNCYREDPGNRGYLPLNFYSAVDIQPRFINVRPLALPSYVIDRDKVGGVDGKGGSIKWQVMLEAIDPRIYGAEFTTAMGDTGGVVSSQTETLVNEGTYPAPVVIKMVSPASEGAGEITITLNGVEMVLTVPNEAVDQTFIWDTKQDILLYKGTSGTFAVRMDLVDFPGSNVMEVPPGGCDFEMAADASSEVTGNESWVTYHETYV